jgi:hypothetical protein
MDNWTTAATTTNPVTRESLDAAIAEFEAKFGPRSRDVFVYPGSMDAFKADLAASGVEVRGNAIEVPGIVPVPFSLHPFGSLQCWEVGGNVWIAGNHRDVEDARIGKIPFKWLRPRTKPGDSSC